MRRIFTTLCGVLLMLSLTACMTARGAMDGRAMSGLWIDQEGRLYALDADGVLGMPGQKDVFGVDWAFDGDVLTLRTLDAPGKPVREAVYTLQKKNLFSLDFRSAEGALLRLRKSHKSVKALDGTLFYRERMMLPPDVLVSASLASPDGKAVAASLRPAQGQGQLSFRVHYLGQDFDERAMLSACILYGAEPLFATPAPVDVALDAVPSVLLHHAIPSEEASPKLKDTYWRLKEVGGRPAEHYDDQPEAHLILKDKGEATGSDGCNNFFMNWSGQEDALTFTPGGATLRLCPHGEEQARALYEALPAVNSFRIKGTTLKLLSGGRVTVVFEAVEM